MMQLKVSVDEFLLCQKSHCYCGFRRLAVCFATGPTEKNSRRTTERAKFAINLLTLLRGVHKKQGVHFFSESR